MFKKIFNNKKSIIILIILLIIIFLGGIAAKKYFDKYIANKVVNIVFTTDKNYTEYLKVAILSAIDNKNPESIYNINILCIDLPNKKYEEFIELAKNIENVKIKTIPLKIETLKGIGEFETKNKVSRVDLFKFFIPDIFPELDKILYMDADILVLKDLTKLYNTDISKHYIGAIKKYEYRIELFRTKNGTFNYGKYYTYNCGILLYNLKKWRETNIKDKLIEAKNNDMIRELVTQKSFNDIIPLSNIKQISPIYNAMGRMEPKDFKAYKFRKIYRPYCNNMWTFNDFIKNVAVVHYAGQKKPWYTTDLLFAEEWWKYAKKINPQWELEQDTSIK